MAKYYKPSGKFSPSSFLYLALVCITGAPILALVYSYAIWYIPFIYINFLIAAGLGVFLGFALNYVVIEKGKVRNGVLAVLLGLIGGVAALYLHWAIWLDLVINSGESYGTDSIGITVSNISIIEALGLILNPASVFELIGLINEQGTWGFKGNTVSGMFLTVIWSIEALIILLIPAMLTYGRAKKPFSEITDSWTNEKVLPPLEFIPNEAAFKTALEQGDFAFLSVIKRAEDSVKEKHSLFTLYYSDAREYFLSVTNKTPEINSKGEVTFKDSEIVEYLILNATSGEQLIKLEHKQVAATA